MSTITQIWLRINTLQFFGSKSSVYVNTVKVVGNFQSSYKRLPWTDMQEHPLQAEEIALVSSSSQADHYFQQKVHTESHINTKRKESPEISLSIKSTQNLGTAQI